MLVIWTIDHCGSLLADEGACVIGFSMVSISFNCNTGCNRLKASCMYEQLLEDYNIHREKKTSTYYTQ